MPTDARTRCLPLPGALVSTCVVMLVGLAAHDLAGGAHPAASQVLLHALTDVSAAHVHHAGLAEDAPLRGPPALHVPA